MDIEPRLRIWLAWSIGMTAGVIYMLVFLLLAGNAGDWKTGVTMVVISFGTFAVSWSVLTLVVRFSRSARKE